MTMECVVTNDRKNICRESGLCTQYVMSEHKIGSWRKLIQAFLLPVQQVMNTKNWAQAIIQRIKILTSVLTILLKCLNMSF